ncbi:MAG: hypothetical protein AAGU18_10920 [Proteiniphilum sp.]
MEMPVPCSKCGEWVELNSTRQGPLSRELICANCCREEESVSFLIDEAKDIHYDLKNYAEHMKGDRRGWKKNLKELTEKISVLGYSFDDFI